MVYIRNTYSTGQLEIEGGYSFGEKDGLFKYYYDNGQLMREGTYQNGEVSGSWTKYQKNGRAL